MHSHDPKKSDTEFQAEFEKILQAAGEGEADFAGFIFPDAHYHGKEFVAKCNFYGARFTGDVDFGSARFADIVFANATFTQDANFRYSTFMHNADFTQAIFTQDANFSEATFRQDANFDAATFTQNAFFHAVAFKQNASFYATGFTKTANFIAVTFTQNAYFSQAKFMGYTMFSGTFTQDADFSGAAFTLDGNFRWATFARHATFSRAKFPRGADFGGAKFLGAVEFRETHFERGDGLVPGPLFSLAQFSKPEAVVFYKTYLGRALFHNCDVSKLTFSSVEWCRRKPLGKRMVFEELVDLDNGAAAAVKPKEGSPDERDYGLIAELYQQLKKNYDDKKDYWTAGDFHYGEMEMKRLASPRKKRFLRWTHSKLGLVAWYKYASQYGESYARPALWLLGVLLFFACLYPLVGLQYEVTRDRPQAKSAPVVPTPQPANPPSNTTTTQSPEPVVLTYSLPFRPGEDTHGSWRRLGCGSSGKACGPPSLWLSSKRNWFTSRSICGAACSRFSSKP